MSAALVPAPARRGPCLITGCPTRLNWPALLCDAHIGYATRAELCRLRQAYRAGDVCRWGDLAVALVNAAQGRVDAVTRVFAIDERRAAARRTDQTER